MPKMRCVKEGKLGWKWGSAGTCYTGPKAFAKMTAQRKAIKASKKRLK